jgi:hypothetical protein
MPEYNYELAESLAKISDIERQMLISQVLGKACDTRMTARIGRVEYRPAYKSPFRDGVSIVLELFGNTDDDDHGDLVGALQQMPDSEKASQIADAFSRATDLQVKCVITNMRYPERVNSKRGVGMTIVLGTIAQS